MTRFDFAQVSAPDDNVRVSCTDATEIENLILLLQPLNSGLKVKRIQTQAKETWDWCISGFSSAKNVDVLWWMLKQLGLHGWEPFGADHNSANRITRYQFRRKSS